MIWFTLATINLSDPLNPWSLTIPFLLLALIVMAAVYFVRINIK